MTGLRAQVSITVPEANITSQSDFTLPITSGTYSALLGVAVTIGVSSSAAAFSASAGSSGTLPLSVAHIAMYTIGGVNLLSGSSEVTLSTSDQTIYSSLLAIGGGAIVANYRTAIAGTIWKAGVYSTSLNFSPSARISPSSQTLTYTVPGFITLNTAAPPTTAVNVNSLSYFRAASGISTTAYFDYFASVPTLLSLRSSLSTFNFTTSFSYTSTPVTSTSLLAASITDASAGPAIGLSATDQLLSTSAGIPVATANKLPITATFSITGANLKTGFIQAGTYTLPLLTWTIAKPSAAYPSSLDPKTFSTALQVSVSNLAELSVQTPNVSLAVNSATAYRLGVTQQMPNHILVSATVPYTVTVKASSNFFSSSAGAQIPVSVVTIEGMSTQSGITPVVLSSTPQVLLSSGSPVIDRPLSLQYRIPAAKTSSLVGLASGTYSTTVTYTLVAP